jgi:hypothetical protein
MAESDDQKQMADLVESGWLLNGTHWFHPEVPGFAFSLDRATAVNAWVRRSLSLTDIHNNVLSCLEGVALLGTAKWLDETYQQANQAGMVAEVVKALRAVVREEAAEAVRGVLREAGLLS